MNKEKLRERLSELDKEYEEACKTIEDYRQEINKQEIRKQQLNGAYAEITRLIKELPEE